MSSVIEARVRQILRKELGEDIGIDFVGDGQFICEQLQVSITPFYAAVNNNGVYFIHDAKVVLFLGWQRILRCETSSWDKSTLELLGVIETKSGTAPETEWPYYYWHECKLRFKDPGIQTKFLEKFRRMKIKSGFSEKSLELFNSWAEFRMSLPITSTQFIRETSHLGSEEEMSRVYFEWGWANDALRMLYFIGRSACEGLIPGFLIPRAIEIYQKRYKDYSRFFDNYQDFNDDQYLLFNETSMLPFIEPSASSGEWAIGTIFERPEDWLFSAHGIEIGQRLVVVNLDKDNSHPRKMRIWNDFNFETSAQVQLKMELTGKDGLTSIGTTMGLITFSNNERSRLTSLETEIVTTESIVEKVEGEG